MSALKFLTKKRVRQLSVSVLFLSLFMLFIPYIVAFFEHKESSKKLTIQEIKKREKKVLKEALSEVEDFKQNASKSSSASSLYSSSSSSSSSLSSLTSFSSSSASSLSNLKTPKLAIIIDDMAFRYQVKRLKSLNMAITPSFFPPSKRYPNTAKYAKMFKHYMVHLPMEANGYFKEERDTLKVGQSYKKIEKVVSSVRAAFPDAKFINNHTGSRFTSNLDSLNLAFKAFNKYGFVFVDSRTTAKTKAKSVCAIYNQPYIARDIFLDNSLNISKIKEQLKKAVRIAKKRGYAIAIGHPHKNTFKALKASKDILKDVRLIYIDELFKEIR